MADGAFEWLTVRGFGMVPMLKSVDTTKSKAITLALGHSAQSPMHASDTAMLPLAHRQQPRGSTDRRLLRAPAPASSVSLRIHKSIVSAPQLPESRRRCCHRYCPLSCQIWSLGSRLQRFSPPSLGTCPGLIPPRRTARQTERELHSYRADKRRQWGNQTHQRVRSVAQGKPNNPHLPSRLRSLGSCKRNTHYEASALLNLLVPEASLSILASLVRHRLARLKYWIQLFRSLLSTDSKRGKPLTSVHLRRGDSRRLLKWMRRLTSEGSWLTPSGVGCGGLRMVTGPAFWQDMSSCSCGTPLPCRGIAHRTPPKAGYPWVAYVPCKCGRV